MGYYTKYRLSVIEGDSNPHGDNSLVNQFRQECENAKYAIDEDGECNEECKWYDAQKDLMAFSIKHPKAIFLLEGSGEESADEWRLYVQDGHFQLSKATIVFPPFDKSKLQAEIRESKIDKVLKN